LRTGRSRTRWFELGLGCVVVAGATVLGAAAQGTRGALAGALLGLGVAAALVRILGRGDSGRRDALTQPFPEAWRELLLDRYDHYDRLSEDLRARFEDDIRLFLAEKRITGVEMEVGDELRLLVAASAVTLSVGWPEYDWDQLTEVLLYPQAFDRDRDYSFDAGGPLVGEAHSWGTVILSVPALLRSFEDPDDGYHVGIHEFAHLLDANHTRFDGIPAGLDPRRTAEWVGTVEKEMERLERGKSVLDPYGGESPAEFLAVAVEAFFETPLALRQRHRELYAILSEYFAQDPAAWDDARGLLL
jgi:Mlc titration factor MtfA (ptsG expression regulator)